MGIDDLIKRKEKLIITRDHLLENLKRREKLKEDIKNTPSARLLMYKDDVNELVDIELKERGWI